MIIKTITGRSQNFDNVVGFHRPVLGNTRTGAPLPSPKMGCGAVGSMSMSMSMSIEINSLSLSLSLSLTDDVYLDIRVILFYCLNGKCKP
jgi:hypothetical protein